jgi:hypothetical protein
VDTVYSINGVPIRFTEERWRHIVENKPYMETYYDKILESVEKPTFILRGYAGSLVAVLPIARRKYLHVVYKEVSSSDGFIVTAFVATKYNRGLMIWPKNA